MEQLINNLKYDYNYNIFLVKALLPNLENVGKRSLVVRWLQKLERCGGSVDEMRLRNDFLYHLTLSVQRGELTPPFDSKPPTGSILTFAHLLPRGVPAPEDANVPHGGGPEEERPLLYARSPDGGAFLAAQPVPRAGAFAYLAVLCRQTAATAAAAPAAAP